MKITHLTDPAKVDLLETMWPLLIEMLEARGKATEGEWVLESREDDGCRDHGGYCLLARSFECIASDDTFYNVAPNLEDVTFLEKAANGISAIKKILEEKTDEK